MSGARSDVSCCSLPDPKHTQALAKLAHGAKKNCMKANIQLF
jgi:hypothetical protein